MPLKSWRGASGGVAAAARPCPPALPVYSAPPRAERAPAAWAPYRRAPCRTARRESVERGPLCGGRNPAERFSPSGKRDRRGNVAPFQWWSGIPAAPSQAIGPLPQAKRHGSRGRPCARLPGGGGFTAAPPPLPPPPRRCRRRPGGGGCRQRSGVSRSHAGDGTDGTVPRSPLRIKFHGSPGGTGAGPPNFPGAFRPKGDHGVSVFRPDSHGCRAGHLGRRRWASPPQSTHCAP